MANKMDDITKKVFKHTSKVAAAIGKATVKGTIWTAEQDWNHKEEIAGGVVGGAKGLYHFGQNVYGLTINKKDFATLLGTLRAQSKEYVHLADEIGKRFSKREILLASIGTKVFCKYGKSKVLNLRSLQDTIATNEAILKRMRRKLQSC